MEGGPFTEATPINDPWTSRVLRPEQEAVTTHRRTIQAKVERGGVVTRQDQYQEAWLLYEAREFDDALAAIDDFLMDHGDTAPALNLRGLVLGFGKREAEAADCYQRASEIDTTTAVYRGNYGCALFRLGRVPEAIAAIRGALDREPDLTYLYEWLGDIYRQQADEPAALREYRRGLELAVTETGRCRNWRRAWERRARLHRKLSEYEAADEAARHLRKMRDDGAYGGDSSNMAMLL